MSGATYSLQAEFAQVLTVNLDRSSRQLDRSEQSLNDAALPSTRPTDDSDFLASFDLACDSLEYQR